MELKGNSIELSTFLKYGLTEVKKAAFIVHIQLGSKYASVSVTLHLTFLKRTLRKVNEIF